MIHINKILMLAALLLPSVFATAQGSHSEIELKLLTNPQPFFSMIEEEQELQGYSIELNRAILQNAGYQLTVESLPWARVLKRSQDHQLSVISALARTPAREDSYYWVTPISLNHIGIYTLDTRAHSIESIEGAAKWGSIAVLRDDYRHQILSDRNIENIMAFNRWPVAIQSLLRGRSTSLFFSDMGIILTCADQRLDCSSIKRIYTYDRSVSYLALKKNNALEPVYIALKKSAEEFKQSLAFEKLIDRYLNGAHPAAKFLEIKDGIIQIKSP